MGVWRGRRSGTGRCRPRSHRHSSRTRSPSPSTALSISSSLDTMSDDFIRLVSQANPAARYQPANNGYPPPNSDQQLDPFFDDEDEDDVPDSAFGVSQAAMKSQDSGLPFSRAGAQPAGHSQVTLATTAAIPPDWSFDDDEPPKQPGAPGSTPATRPKHKRRSSRSLVGRVKKLRWPWQKGDKVLAGDRVIALNNPDANTDYCSNYISTSKYNVVTFVPKFLFGAFLVSKCVFAPFVSRSHRAILEIRELVLPLHRAHSANTQCISY